MHQSQQRILYAIAGVLLVGTAGAVHWSTGELGKPDIPAPTVTTGRNVPSESSMAAEATDGISEWSLRSPLYDPPPKSKPRVATVPKPNRPLPGPELELTLIGTIIDSGRSVAIVADASGEFDVKGVGDSLDLSPPGVLIRGIDSEQITLHYQGKDTTIRLTKNDKPIARRRDGLRANNRRKNP